MYTINGSYKVRQCLKCAGDTEYSCLSCPSDLCAECRENHIHDLDTIDHNVVIYREKIYQNPTGHEVCPKHPDNDYEMYCEPCELPVCFYCADHRTHKWQNIQQVYQIKRQHHSKTFQKIRNEAIMYMRVFLPKNQSGCQILSHTILSLSIKDVSKGPENNKWSWRRITQC